MSSIFILIPAVVGPPESNAQNWLCNLTNEKPKPVKVYGIPTFQNFIQPEFLITSPLTILECIILRALRLEDDDG